ncbi:RsmB/NOP family class I SAM-dependent RNA methyltransferase [Candidatus Nucleicultrix amoebiphila]|jgi:16S rRNA (cytosine967-C5)-methyltransferase|uniref:RsmB/NOP family class I SAM-dependent RNA methyltransferase n=1 Tax=Candidatus Nucleicultrix amoebiphila TaxID=1509244 RepID=UPI000A26F681|nr:RsmB/NOP family class I SAM-dependent RNA methyltransferase [Candidatus Nucleicultrix amoebiphila]
MTPAARLQSLLELIPIITDGSRPMDEALQNYFIIRRFMGSQDRRFIKENLYNIARTYGHHHSAWSQFSQRESINCDRAVLLSYLWSVQKKSEEDLYGYFTGEKYAPQPISSYELSFIKWLPTQKISDWDYFNVSEPIWNILQKQWTKEQISRELEALDGEAPLDLRVNLSKISRDQLIKLLLKENIKASETPLSPSGIRINGRPRLQALTAYKNGFFEIQDEGSQILSLIVGAQPGEIIVDYCAGAGGKTLAMADHMQNKGRIIALDKNLRRLERAKERIKRADVRIVEFVAEGLKEKCEAVLADVPCSGSGTWRRHPELKWVFNLKSFDEIKETQQAILEEAAFYVKPGGRLVYSTCSIFFEENQDQIEKFLRNHSDFKLHPICFPPLKSTSYLTLTPYTAGTDGFFAAVLIKMQ